MDFFEIKQPIRRIGKDKYVIGNRPLDPLITVDGKSIKVDVGIFKETYSELSSTHNLILKTGRYDNLSGINLNALESSINNLSVDNLTIQSGNFENISGNTLSIDTGFSDTFYIKNIDILNFISSLSGQLIDVERNLQSGINELSGQLIDVERNLQSGINELSGQLLETGLYLESKINQIDQGSGQQFSTGSYAESRYLLQEAFERDEFGDITPTNHPFISDPMWILREEGDLELRANIWRYNTGPDAFTEDISF